MRTLIFLLLYVPGSFYFPASSTSTLSSASGLGCSDDIAVKSKGVKPLAIASDTDTCSTGFPDYVAENNANFQYRQDYDTMRYWYIPHCYPIAEASQTAGALSGSASEAITSFDSLLDYRNFNIHCLTLRNDDEWFCAFVANLAGTYSDSSDIYMPDYRAARAIWQYLVDNPRCASGVTGNEFSYQELLYTQRQIWADTSKPGTTFDSTMPTLQQLGLDSVLIINGQAGVTYAVPTPPIINSASVLENPFQNSTSILVSIGRESYVTIGVYNVLGQQVRGAGYAGVFEQGSRTIPLDMTSAPSGAYYVRISTANNETQTLKLTKGMRTLIFLLLYVPGSFYFPASSTSTLSSASGLGCSNAFTCPPTTMECTIDDLLTKRKGSISLSNQSADTGMSHCDSLFNIGYEDQQEGLWKNSYDTLRLFLEECPNYAGTKYNAGVVATNAFNYVSSSVTQWQAGGTGRWSDFLTWLKQVLYLRQDTSWYCSDVMDMITAVQSDEASQEAITYYILTSGKCPAITFQTLYNSASHWRHEEWLDSIVGKFDTVVPYGKYSWWVDSLVNQDTLANPYDSTIPSLQQENLQILLGPENASSVGASSPITSEALLTAQLLENPMKDEIDVSYDMGRTALVTMELRDVLGRAVPIANAKYQLEQPGSHDATIPVPNLPQGIYYLRITTDVGDAITLKIVKE